MSEEFPRVLVVTANNFNLITGGGITLTNLFRGWPSDHLANVHEDALPEDRTVCQRCYRLTHEEIRWVGPFSLVQGWYGQKKQQGLAMGATEGASSAGGWLSVVKRLLGDGAPKRAQLTPQLIEWVERFQPTVLYGFLGSLEQITLLRSLAARFHVPTVVHMMDDWPAVLHRRGLLGPIVGPMVRRELAGALREARVRLAICEEMCEEYRRRYGYEFTAFQNALDPAQWLPHARTDWGAGRPFVVRYVGSILPDGQKDSLKDIAQAVVGLWKSGRRVQLRVHAPKADADYLRALAAPSEALLIEGPPDPALVPRMLAEADLLLLPYNFDERSARYIRFSLPTKAPAYMMSATPVLVYAPADVATARMRIERAGGMCCRPRGKKQYRRR